MKTIRTIHCLIVLLFLIPCALRADEGMYPISEIQKLNLRAKGLKIELKELYNPKGISLIDAIVQVGGCTGSFVSDQGLILTNHHCAFGAAQAASTVENDYITNGFLANNLSQEIPAKGYTVRITESYRDVSKEVLSVMTDQMDLAERTKAIEKKSKEIIAEAEKNNPGKRAEVSEMFAGRTYVLFLYGYIRDVRLVYVPPRSIGEFGGEHDNWVWPRHTGDFSFMRAYVAPDGSPAEYSATNVPYKPKKVLKVQASGANEGDFVFILGYPGRTFRHRTSQYLQYEEDWRMPYVANLYEWEIAVMEQQGEKDRSVAIKNAARIKSMANVLKNYRGKLKGLKRLGLVEKKRKEEKELQTFIDADTIRRERYGSVLQEIGAVYEEMNKKAETEIILDNLLPTTTGLSFSSGPVLLNLGYVLFESTREMQKADLERASAFMARNASSTRQTLQQALQNYDEQTDRIILKELLSQAAKLPSDQRIPGIDNLIKGANAEAAIDQFIEGAYTQSKLGEEKVYFEAWGKTPETIDQMGDPFLQLVKDLAPTYRALKETRQRREGALSRLSALLVDVKEQFLQKDFIPDANRTLRLTFGTIRGYSPADATWYQPITSLRGVIEKTTGEEPFDTPQKIVDMYYAKDFGRYQHAKLKDVPVALLYDLDTTGGNSGSPLLNARGEVVGVNFDRAFEATINDYAWSESYSRSIAVDVRYVLWVTEKFGGVGFLLKEMGIR